MLTEQAISWIYQKILLIVPYYKQIFGFHLQYVGSESYVDFSKIQRSFLTVYLLVQYVSNSVYLQYHGGLARTNNLETEALQCFYTA